MAFEPTITCERVVVTHSLISGRKVMKKVLGIVIGILLAGGSAMAHPELPEGRWHLIPMPLDPGEEYPPEVLETFAGPEESRGGANQSDNGGYGVGGFYTSVGLDQCSVIQQTSPVIPLVCYYQFRNPGSMTFCAAENPGGGGRYCCKDWPSTTSQARCYMMQAIIPAQ